MNFSLKSPFLIEKVNFVNFDANNMMLPQICVMEFINDWILANIPGNANGNLSTISNPMELKNHLLGPGFYLCCDHIPERSGEHVDILEKQIRQPGGFIFGPTYNYKCRARFFLVGGMID